MRDARLPALPADCPPPERPASRASRCARPGERAPAAAAFPLHEVTSTRYL
jgi:hypothetical protein